MYTTRFLSILLFAFAICIVNCNGSYVVWSCDSQTVNGTCFGIVKYEDGAVTQLSVPLGGFDILSGFAVDPQNEEGFLMLANSSVNQNSFAILTVDLQTSTVISYSDTNVTVPSGSQIVDLQYDEQQQMLVALLSVGSIPALHWLEVLQIDPTSGKAVSVLNVTTTFSQYISSSYNSQESTYVAIFADDMTAQMTAFSILIARYKEIALEIPSQFVRRRDTSSNELRWNLQCNISCHTDYARSAIVDDAMQCQPFDVISHVDMQLSKGSVSNIDCPYLLDGIIVNDTGILANVYNTGNDSNALIFFNPSNGNYSYLATYGRGVACGSQINHAALDVRNDVYYTTCCTDPSGCYDSSIVAVDVITGKTISSTPVSLVEQSSYGLFFIS